MVVEVLFKKEIIILLLIPIINLFLLKEELIKKKPKILQKVLLNKIHKMTYKVKFLD
jgi:hypothetical protein